MSTLWRISKTTGKFGSVALIGICRFIKELGTLFGSLLVITTAIALVLHILHVALGLPVYDAWQLLQPTSAPIPSGPILPGN